jgi:putative aminopeptidase FrvX
LIFQRGYRLGLRARAVVLGLSTCLLQGALPRVGFAQDHPIRFIQVQRELIESRLRRVARENADRESSLKQIFTEAGCDGERLQEQPIKRQKLPNVICTLPGSSDSVIVIGAHFDHVERGEGVVDNWSGAGLLPSLFQSLNGEPRKHTIIFIGFAAEEQGLIGSDFYVKQLAQEQVAKIQIMIDLDSLGLGPTSIWLKHSDEKLADMLNGVAASIKLPLGVVNAEQIGDEDSTSFRKRHVPTVMLHSVTQQTVRILHSDSDNLSAIRVDDYYDSYHLIAVYLAYLDGKLD